MGSAEELALWATIKAKRAQSDLEEYRDQSFPTDTVRTIIDWLIQVLGLLRNRAEVILEEIPTSYRPADYEDEIRTIGQFIMSIHSWGRYFLTARVEAKPFGMAIATAFENLVLSNFSVKSAQPRCIIRSQWNYNFKHIPLGHQLRELSKKQMLVLGMNKLMDKIPSDIAVISYPSLESQNALVYPILAHEVGHFLDGIHNISGSIMSSFPSWNEILQQLMDLLPLKDRDNAMKGKRGLRILETLGRELRDILEWIRGWLAEITSDLIAVRLLGPAFFFALDRTFSCLTRSGSAGSRSHPPPQTRLREVHNEMVDPRAGLEYPVFFLKQRGGGNGITAKVSDAFLNTLRDRWDFPVASSEPSELRLSGTEGMDQEKLLERRSQIVESVIEGPLGEVRQKVRDLIPKDRAFAFDESIFKQVDLLRHYIPPCQLMETKDRVSHVFGFESIVNAAWLHHYLSEEDRVLPIFGNDPPIYPFDKNPVSLNELYGNLVLSAIDFSIAKKKWMGDRKKEHHETATGKSERPTRVGDEVSHAGVETAEGIEQRISRWHDNDGFVITPVLGSLVAGAGLDVTLGCRFLVFKRRGFGSIDISEDKKVLAQHSLEWQQEIYIPFGERFVIHPGDFVLGITLEYLAFPLDLMGYVIGRSSLGRLGLIIATATKIDPGYRGVLTLELTNVGAAPLILHPGEKIAQIVFHRLSTPVEPSRAYCGQFQFSFSPRGYTP